MAHTTAEERASWKTKIEHLGLESQRIKIKERGWYRIAMIKLPGSYGSETTFQLGRVWAPLPEMIDFTLIKSYNPSNCQLIVNRRSGNVYTTKVRILYKDTRPQDNVAYLDVYSNTTHETLDNKFDVRILHDFSTNTNSDERFRWKYLDEYTGELAEIPEGYSAIEFDLTKHQIQADTARIKSIESLDANGNTITMGGLFTKIQEKIDKKSISNNFTTSDETMIAAAPLVKQLYEENQSLKEEINTLNSNKVSFIALNDGDANNLTDTAIYWLNLWGGTSSWSNLPEYIGGIGTLIVNSHGGSINQTYMNAHSGGKTYQRVFFDNAWRDWICVTNNIQSQLNNALFRSDSPGYDGDNTTSYPSRNSEIVNKEFLSYWNGSYAGNTSNLAYCNQGRFGSMCTKDANNYPTIETTNNLQNQIGTINGNLTRLRVDITYYENNVAYATIPNGTWIITNSHPYGNGLSIYVMLMFGDDLSRCEIYAIKNDPHLTITIESANYVKFQLDRFNNMDDSMENFRWINIQKIGN